MPRLPNLIGQVFGEAAWWRLRLRLAVGAISGRRRRWDSNPRGACTPAGFQDRHSSFEIIDYLSSSESHQSRQLLSASLGFGRIRSFSGWVRQIVPRGRITQTQLQKWNGTTWVLFGDVIGGGGG
jgi:hypothetical protein